MNTVRRFLGLFRDSPTYGRDRANLISGFTIGTTSLFLNAVVLMMVLPLMVDPDDRDFRAITENIEFGQLLALILLGGATAFATLLIPLRLVSVFWGPRIGRYFDQIVLSGISPLRYMIGKATSQNLFLGLILFLLLPYLVLSLTLGGIDFAVFLASLLLVWLYCMALALVTLWVSLYLNELLSACVVTGTAIVLCALGCAPLPIQPFVITPFPALMQPIYASMSVFNDGTTPEFFPFFFSSALCLTSVICLATFGIFLGPLYGIIRENSTFGEVVRAGDSKNKRWFRLRLHIQRPSEVAFFYENRSRSFRCHEGLIRWSVVFLGLLLIVAAAYLIFLYVMSLVIPAPGNVHWWVFEFHTTYLAIHGLGLTLSVFAFSHAKNTTYMRLPFFRGRSAEVSTLDTMFFLFFALLSSAMAIAFPFVFELLIAGPAGISVFTDQIYGTRGHAIDYRHIAVQGTLAISASALVIYALQRLACLMLWIRSVAFVSVVGSYLLAIGLLPVILGAMFDEIAEMRQIPGISDWIPTLVIISPFAVMMSRFNEMGSHFTDELSTASFFIVHGVMIAAVLWGVRRQGRRLRRSYLVEAEPPEPETHPAKTLVDQPPGSGRRAQEAGAGEPAAPTSAEPAWEGNR